MAEKFFEEDKVKQPGTATSASTDAEPAEAPFEAEEPHEPNPEDTRLR